MNAKHARKFLKRNAWKLARRRLDKVDGWLEQSERVAWDVIMWGHLNRIDRMVFGVERM